jgi:hypothetical protein
MKGYHNPIFTFDNWLTELRKIVHLVVLIYYRKYYKDTNIQPDAEIPRLRSENALELRSFYFHGV